MILSKVCAVVGVGPGTGSAVSKRFAKEGFAVALIARNTQKLKPIEEEITSYGNQVLSIGADVSKEESLQKAFEEIRNKLGNVEVLIYNASASPFPKAGILDISTERFENDWKITCKGALVAAKEVLGPMAEAKKGTIIFTNATAAWKGGVGFGSFAAGKFGLRALTQSAAREFGPQGVHVANVIIDGIIDTPTVRSFMPNVQEEDLLNPAEIAEQYYQLHKQHRSTWTTELELRPFKEKW